MLDTTDRDVLAGVLTAGSTYSPDAKLDALTKLLVDVFGRLDVIETEFEALRQAPSRSFLDKALGR